MNVTLSINEEELIEIIKQHLQSKVGNLSVGEVRLYVMSKNNYRIKTWEPAHIIVKNISPLNVGTSQEDTEIRAEVDCD